MPTASRISPIGAAPITLGGKTAKTQQMTDAERKNIEDVNHEIGLFDGDPINPPNHSWTKHTVKHDTKRHKAQEPQKRRTDL